jgi:CspA family cold shock protein
MVQSSGSTVKKASDSSPRAMGGKNVFVHFSAIKGSGYRNLEENQCDSYDAEVGKNGKGPQAINVTVI